MACDRATDLTALPTGQDSLFPGTGNFARAMAAAFFVVVFYLFEINTFFVLSLGVASMVSLSLFPLPALGRSPHFLAALAVVLFVAACAQRVPKAVAYSPGEHLAFRAAGTATVSGEAFLRRPNGRVVRCSGSEVFLVPDTAYFREWISVFRQGNRFEQSADLVDAHKEAVRVTQCDMAGTFRFGQLPAARWFVATRVTYQLDRVDFRKIDLANDYWSDDAMFIAPVETRSGEVSRPVLSNPNRM
jgi:hypothetical protein